ncbi:MAG: hypothetical protein SGILL_004105, partial [Bacillariaceae sp.]
MSRASTNSGTNPNIAETTANMERLDLSARRFTYIADGDSDAFVINGTETYLKWVSETAALKGLVQIMEPGAPMPRDEALRFLYGKINFFVDTLGAHLLPTAYHGVVQMLETSLDIPQQYRINLPRTPDQMAAT